MSWRRQPRKRTLSSECPGAPTRPWVFNNQNFPRLLITVACLRTPPPPSPTFLPFHPAPHSKRALRLGISTDPAMRNQRNAIAAVLTHSAGPAAQLRAHAPSLHRHSLCPCANRRHCSLHSQPRITHTGLGSMLFEKLKALRGGTFTITQRDHISKGISRGKGKQATHNHHFLLLEFLSVSESGYTDPAERAQAHFLGIAGTPENFYSEKGPGFQPWHFLAVCY